jgi:hypothetical protein
MPIDVARVVPIDVCVCQGDGECDLNYWNKIKELCLVLRALANARVMCECSQELY